MTKFLLPAIFSLLVINLGVSGYSLTRCCNCNQAPTPAPVVAALPSPTPTALPVTPSPAPSAPAAVSDERLLVEVNNIAACNFTNQAEFKLDQDYLITRFRTWYSWGANELEIPYTLARGTTEVASGKLTRKDCDPYQRQWCGAADFDFNRQLPAGDYVLKVTGSKICQNSLSGNKGFIYVWGK